MKIHPKLISQLQFRTFSGRAQGGGVGSFFFNLPPVPIGKTWIIFDAYLQGQDPVSAVAVGETDQNLTGVFVVPIAVAPNSVVPQQWNSSTEGIPNPQSIIKIVGFPSEVGFNGAPGGVVASALFQEIYVVPEQYYLQAVWATLSTATYPSVKANLLLTLLMAEVSTDFLQSCL